MKKNISTLLIDLGGVILNLDYNRTIKAFQDLGIKDFEAIYSQAAQSNIFDLFETGKINEDAFRAYLKEIIDLPNLTDENIDYAWNAMLLDLPYERIDLLNQLKTKYKLILFSNTNAIHFQKFRKIIDAAHGDSNLLESTFDKTYYSHILGERKPNQIAFKTILDQEGIKPEEVVFIDDTIQHIEGAKSIGIEARHLVNMDLITCCNDLL